MPTNTMGLGPMRIEITTEEIEIMTMEGQSATVQTRDPDIEIVVALPSGDVWRGTPEDLAHELDKYQGMGRMCNRCQQIWPPTGIVEQNGDRVCVDCLTKDPGVDAQIKSQLPPQENTEPKGDPKIDRIRSRKNG